MKPVLAIFSLNKPKVASLAALTVALAACGGGLTQSDVDAAVQAALASTSTSEAQVPGTTEAPRTTTTSAPTTTTRAPTTTTTRAPTTTTRAPTTNTTTQPQFTRSEENAIQSAESYLDVMAFSRSGLIDQLAYEGFTTAEATLAVDHLNADWNEQAWKSAESYLDVMAFSRSGLIDQLEYEGFTAEQATYGVGKTGL